MARSRMIKPEFWDDEKLGMKTSLQARLIFIGLWNHSDDYGVVKGNPTWLKNHILPYEDSLSAHAFKKWLSELENIRCIIPFDHEGENFFYIKSFTKYQAINRPSKQRNPAPPDNILEDSVNAHGVLIDETETETEYIADSSESASHSSEEKSYPTKSGKKLTGKRLETFELFWGAFNFKKGKSAAADSWLKIPSLTDALTQDIVSAAEKEAARRPGLEKSGGSPKWAQGWLTERRWEDECYSEAPSNAQPKKTMVFEVTDD